MKTTGKTLAALLAALLMFSLTACRKSGLDIPLTMTGREDFQKNLHQTEGTGVPTFVETDTGYYVGYGRLYYLERVTGRMTVLCAKPDCDHSDPDTCNAMIDANYLLTGGERLYYVSNSNDPRTVGSVRPDATGRETVQELKFNEFSASQSSYDTAIYHRGYIYYVSDDILYRVKLGGEKDSAEEIWKPEGAGSSQSYADGRVDFNPNAIHYTLWADGETLYFMANVQTADGTYKDVLFRCGLDGSDVREVWVTPGAAQVGAWQTTGVSVSQWYVTNGFIYFYLSGGDFWRTDLETGRFEKLADTTDKTLYGSAVFSDDRLCLLNDRPLSNPFGGTLMVGAPFHQGGDTVFVYDLEGALLKELSLGPLTERWGTVNGFTLLFCDRENLYFNMDAGRMSEKNGVSGKEQNNVLCRVNIDTGQITEIYSWQ